MAVLRKYLWLIVFPIAFAVYSMSFSGFQVIKEKNSVLAEADSAPFSILIEDFHLSKKYGDEYNTVNRGNGDIAQKHKVHHILYVMVASWTYEALRSFYGLLGISSNQALFSVNALLACVNIGLLYALLRHFIPGKSALAPYLLFYAFSLNTMIYSSVPESWPFSATLILLFLVLLYKRKSGTYLLSFYVGIAMLNNIFLSSLLVFLWMRHLAEAVGVNKALRKTLLSAAIAVMTWVAAISALSLFDASLRPYEFVLYTLWFKKFIAYNRPVYDPYVLKSIITNLFVNSVVSNQPDPAIPQESLKHTLKGSPTGLLATIIYVSASAVTLYNMLKAVKGAVEERGLKAVLEMEPAHLAVYCAAWIFLTMILYPPAAFFYSTVVVPLLVILIAVFIDTSRPSQRVLLYATVASIIINNFTQVMRFREALSTLQ